MKQYDENIFDAATEITAAVAEESDAPLSAEGGRAAAEFFRAVYDGIAAPDGDEAKPGGVFEVYRDAAGEFRFRLKAKNGEIIAVSEGYTRRESCLGGVAAVRRYAALAAVNETD